jgi:hypothetical protein|tara:strand:+ start:1039 stop:1323 length:285 start_codon:yes stop_codon:yes gene_type:complete
LVQKPIGSVSNGIPFGVEKQCHSFSHFYYIVFKLGSVSNGTPFRVARRKGIFLLLCTLYASGKITFCQEGVPIGAPFFVPENRIFSKPLFLHIG